MHSGPMYPMLYEEKWEGRKEGWRRKRGEVEKKGRLKVRGEGRDGRRGRNGGRRDREERRIKVREGKYFILVKINIVVSISAAVCVPVKGQVSVVGNGQR